ncbi:ANTAR domain-containing protein [Mumia sp. DW29H23]|uniref:GAF and ANTAR domain-containing protein n=1 Tax=Mumia sp. DW29H23 TaxID=3421241 RepID=UPI003D69E840
MNPRQLPSSTDGLDQLRRRIDDAQRDAAPADELYAALESAYERLRVAGDEARAQADLITELSAGRRRIELQLERTLAIVPVPAIVTDGHGLIRSANAAADGLAQRSLTGMLDQPLFVLFSGDDKAALRRVTGLCSAGREPVHRAATLVTRTGQPVRVEITASSAEPDRVQWILLVAGASRRAFSPALTQALGAIAAIADEERPATDALATAAGHCRRALGGAAEVSIALGPPTEPQAVASTSGEAQSLDGAQMMSCEGPTVAAFVEGTTVTSEDLAHDPRWPALRDLPGRGSTSVIACPLVPTGKTTGVLTVYRADDVAPEAVEVLAVTLSAVLVELDLMDELDRMSRNMDRALESRAVIDQAKGIVMAELGLDADLAWRHIVALSNDRNVKARQIAYQIVETATRRKP